MRSVLDNQSGQPVRPRNYDDEIQRYDYPPPENAPDWAYIDEPGMVYDTDAEKTDKEDGGDDEEDKDN